MPRPRPPKKWLWLGVVLLAAAAVLLLLTHRGQRPFQDLEAADLAAVSVSLLPPDVTVTLDGAQRAELAALLREVVVYQRDDAYGQYAGQAVIFTLEMADGAVRTVTAYNPFLVLDGAGYRTAYAPCEALNAFANGLIGP